MLGLQPADKKSDLPIGFFQRVKKVDTLSGWQESLQVEETLFDLVQPGDTILTVEVSRLSRSTQQLCGIIDKVKEKQICLCILGSITVDCRNGEMDAMTKAFLQISAVFCELEVSMLRARVKSSLQHAKAQGKKLGRRPTTKDDIPAVFYKHYPAFMSGTLNVSELARICGLSRPTVYKYSKLVG